MKYNVIPAPFQPKLMHKEQLTDFARMSREYIATFGLLYYRTIDHPNTRAVRIGVKFKTPQTVPYYLTYRSYSSLRPNHHPIARKPIAARPGSLGATIADRVLGIGRLVWQ